MAGGDGGGGGVSYNTGGGRGGECCVAGYYSKVDRIMLRYRPIAPKPVDKTAAFGKADVLFQSSRVKRRYVKGDGNNKRKRRVVSEENISETTQLKMPTLALLPEKPLEKEVMVKEMEAEKKKEDQLVNIWLNLNRQARSGSDRRLQLVAPQPVRPLGSCVTVESVTCDGGVEVMGGTDEEKMRRLEEDACPGFISDGMNRVRWMNEAYRRMVRKEEGGEEREGYEIMVWLVMKERVEVELVEVGTCRGFACWVRLEYMSRKERNKLMVPCDVWRMDGGGFAWRLDVKAALGLGR